MLIKAPQSGETHALLAALFSNITTISFTNVSRHVLLTDLEHGGLHIKLRLLYIKSHIMMSP